MSFFGTVLTTLVTLLHLYVFVRVDSLPLRRCRVSRKVLIGAGLALWLVFVLGREYGGRQGGLPGVVLEFAGMDWMASVFLLAVGLFVADLACGFGLLFRKAAVRIRAWGLVLGLTMVVIAHVQGLRPPVIETYEVEIMGLPGNLDGTTIAMIADLHAGEMMVGPRWLSARIDQVHNLHPDMIVLVGDLFESGSDPAEMAPAVQRLAAPLGVWAVRGNHDSLRPGRRDVTGEILGRAGIRLLANEWLRVADGLVLAGIDDLTASRRRPGEGQANLAKALADRPADTTILLSHTAWLTDQAAAAGVDLMLSGHTHNGQIWPFNYFVRTRYPFVGGRYAIGSMALVVTRGTGTWGPRMRLWAPGEISFVTLRAFKAGK